MFNSFIWERHDTEAQINPLLCPFARVSRKGRHGIVTIIIIHCSTSRFEFVLSKQETCWNLQIIFQALESKAQKKKYLHKAKSGKNPAKIIQASWKKNFEKMTNFLYNNNLFCIKVKDHYYIELFIMFIPINVTDGFIILYKFKRNYLFGQNLCLFA